MAEPVVLRSTYNGHVPIWYVIGSSKNKYNCWCCESRGSGGATAAAARMEGGIRTGMR